MKTNFSELIFHLVAGKFFAFRKPNNQTLYISAKSNHLPTIIKDIPNPINTRMSDLSCNKKLYEKLKPWYETTLNESGFKTTMAYTKITTINNRSKGRNIIWINPPYSQNVQTNVRKNIPSQTNNYTVYTIFNRNTLKLSCSCMSNISTIIKQY